MNTQKKAAASLAVVAGLGTAVAGGFLPQSASAQSAPHTATVLAKSHVAATISIARPKVTEALRYLMLAETSLSQGIDDAHVFGYHRLKAQQLTRQAIVEAQKALAYAANAKH